MAEGHTPLWTNEELTDRRTSFAQHSATTAAFTRCDVGQVISVDTLPDDVLLAIVSSLCDNVADLYIYKRPHSQLDWK